MEMICIRASTLALSAVLATAPSAQSPTTPKPFIVWATSCAHIESDAFEGRASIARAIEQSEGPVGFEWDVWIDAGDLSSSNRSVTDSVGEELVRQYGRLQRHRREQIYNVQGNHDASYFDGQGTPWFRKWADPLGEHTEFSGVDPRRRPFAVEGEWFAYRFLAGNVLFLMLSDRNDMPTPVGRGSDSVQAFGGFPAGAVTRETFEWWKRQVLDNQDKIIVTMHHHVLAETTAGSGPEMKRFHHGKGAEGSAVLHYIIEDDDPDNFRHSADRAFETFFEQFEAEHGRGAIDLWVGGHTHVHGPDYEVEGRTTTETCWGVHFLQVAALTQHHTGSIPQSRVLEFVPERANVRARVFLHEPMRDRDIGFYEPRTVELPLRHAFQPAGPIAGMAPFPSKTRTNYPVIDRWELRKSNRGYPLFQHGGPSADLTGRWDRHGSGNLFVVEQVKDDELDAIRNRPEVVRDEVGRDVLRFYGTERVVIGPIDMEGWTDLTVCVTAKPSTTQSQHRMRLVSKSRAFEGRGFSLSWERQQWQFSVRDRSGNSPRLRWRPSSRDWVHLACVVDSKSGTVSMYADGELVASIPWDGVIDDGNGAPLVIGAESSERRFSGTFQGSMSDVRLYPRALSQAEIRELVTRD